MSQSCVIESESRLVFSFIKWIKSDMITKDELNKSMGIGRVRTCVGHVVTDFVGVYDKKEKLLIVIVDEQIIQFDKCSILTLEDKKSHKWVLVDNDTLPKYALRASFDPITKNSIFIGRSKNRTGTVSSNDSRKSLSFTHDNETANKTLSYEILCLRPTPANLKHLCRLFLRDRLDNDNQKIKLLSKYLKTELIFYLRYPSVLKCGKCLLRGDAIWSNNDQYRLILDHHGRLFFKLDFGKSHLFLYDNVDSLQFSEFGLIVNYSHDNSSQTFINDFDGQSINFSDSHLSLNNNGYLLINSAHYETNFFIQFRDDIPSFLNQTKPYFIHTVFASERVYGESSTEDNESSTDDDDDDDEDSDDDDTSTDSNSNE